MTHNLNYGPVKLTILTGIYRELIFTADLQWISVYSPLCESFLQQLFYKILMHVTHDLISLEWWLG